MVAPLVRPRDASDGPRQSQTLHVAPATGAGLLDEGPIRAHTVLDDAEGLFEAGVEAGRLGAGANVPPDRHAALHHDAVADAEIGQQAVDGHEVATHGAQAD